MRKICADLIITHIGDPLSRGVIFLDDLGTIIEVKSSAEGLSDVEYYRGVLCPGYVNAHCHLELSHLKGIIPTGTGLIPFIKDVVTKRDFAPEVIAEHIKEADLEMYREGIVAVGDISNTTDTIATKGTSQLRYYTFVEMFDFLQDDQAEATYKQYQSVYQAHHHDHQHRKSMVPHAPYSVSPNLMHLINQHNDRSATLSIHNQELAAENDLFLHGDGAFIDFYTEFGISLARFVPIGRSSIYYAMANLHPSFRILMVHNTTTQSSEVKDALDWNPETFWVTCPNANLYIENQLPDYTELLAGGARICIGTDSLSSNWQLSVYEEMKTIKKYQSFLHDLDIVKWATLHGALALGYEDLGRLQPGTRPGINWINVPVYDGRFDLRDARESTKLA